MTSRRKAVHRNPARRPHRWSGIQKRLLSIAAVLLVGSVACILVVYWPVSPSQRPGFAWLATRVIGEDLANPITKRLDFAVKADQDGITYTTPPSVINVSYSIAAPCGNGETPFALFLAGDARLEGITSEGGGAADLRIDEAVETSLPELGTQSVQLISGTISDGPICVFGGAEEQASTVVEVHGRWRSSFYTETWAHEAVSIPLAGRPWTSWMRVDAPAGLSGRWSSPRPGSVTVTAFGFDRGDRIDAATGAVARDKSLVWTSEYGVVATALWTHVSAEQVGQNIVTIVTGLFLAIGVALLVARMLK